MREYRETDEEGHFPYGRPSGAAWVAAAAVAFAFFVLGGFIKTYRQLETLRDESRREIRELRKGMESLRAAGAEASRAAARVPRLPQAVRQPYPTPAGPEAERSPSRSESGRAGVANSLPPLIPELEGERRGLTYEFGRKSKADPGGGRRDQLQVISVASPQKRLRVEGGRDVGLAEGARLELSRGGRWIGDLRALEVYDTMTACEVVHATHPPQPGDTVRIP